MENSISNPESSLQMIEDNKILEANGPDFPPSHCCSRTTEIKKEEINAYLKYNRSDRRISLLRCGPAKGVFYIFSSSTLSIPFCSVADVFRRKNVIWKRLPLWGGWLGCAMANEGHLYSNVSRPFPPRSVLRPNEAPRGTEVCVCPAACASTCVRVFTVYVEV